MTCIVAFKTTDNSIILAGDYMASNTHSARRVAMPKVFLKSDNCAIGFTDSFRMGQILEHLWSLPPRLEGMTDSEYVFTMLVQSIKETLNSYGYGGKHGLEEQGGNFILVYNDRIYEVQRNFSLLDFDDEVVAVGCGDDAAYGAMHALGKPSDDDVLEYLDKVYSAVNYVTPSVSAEYTFILMEGSSDVESSGITSTDI